MSLFKRLDHVYFSQTKGFWLNTRLKLMTPSYKYHSKFFFFLLIITATRTVTVLKQLSKWCRSLACSCPQRLSGLLLVMVKLYSLPESSLKYPEYGRLLNKPLKEKRSYLNSRNVICSLSVFQRAFFSLFTPPTKFIIVIYRRQCIPDHTNKLSFANYHDAAYQSWLKTVKVGKVFKLHYWTSWRHVAVVKAKLFDLPNKPFLPGFSITNHRRKVKWITPWGAQCDNILLPAHTNKLSCANFHDVPGLEAAFVVYSANKTTVKV